MELTFWKLRLDYNFLDDKKYKDLERKFTRFLRVFERGKGEENPHWHYYIEMYEKQKNIRHYIRTKLNLSGNGGYSLVQVTPQPVEYVSYMLKVQKHLDCHLSDPDDGVLQELWEKAREHCARVKEEIAIKKAGKRPQWKVILETILRDCPEFSFDKEKTIHQVIEYYIENDQLVREFQVQSTVQTLLLHKNNRFRFELQNKILDRI